MVFLIQGQVSSCGHLGAAATIPRMIAPTDSILDVLSESDRCERRASFGRWTSLKCIPALAGADLPGVIWAFPLGWISSSRLAASFVIEGLSLLYSVEIAWKHTPYSFKKESNLKYEVLIRVECRLTTHRAKGMAQS